MKPVLSITRRFYRSCFTGGDGMNQLDKQPKRSLARPDSSIVIDSVPSWQKRVYQERQDLLNKIDKLSEFLQSKSVQDMIVKDYILLKKQLHYMQKYYSVLSERIDRFGDERSVYL
jgi:hypothetical protein